MQRRALTARLLAARSPFALLDCRPLPLPLPGPWSCVPTRGGAPARQRRRRGAGGGGLRRPDAGRAAGRKASRPRTAGGESHWRTPGERGRVAAAEAAVDDLDVAAGGIVALDAVGFDAMETSHRPDETETVTCTRPDVRLRRAGSGAGV